MVDTMDAKTQPSWFFGCARCLALSPRPAPSPDKEAEDHEERRPGRKPGGWSSMPFILGNETFERLAFFGVLANFMVYLRREYHMDQASATNLINLWAGVTNFAPLLGAFLSDAYTGRFWIIAVGSAASFMGMLTMTLTAWIPNLRPPKCSAQQQANCIGPTAAQLGALIAGLGFLSIGTGGIRPCSIPFGVDQFDFTTDEGRRGINSYYNWYYATFTVAVMITLTVVVYIQDSISWVVGFGIPAALMFGSIVLFFLGTKFYVYVEPEGSIFSGIARVIVAAYKKRRLRLPDEEEGVYYNPSLKGILVAKLPITNKFRSLNKATLIVEGDLTPNGTCLNKWNLCSIQQVEEVKCLVKVLPIWASGIICFTAAAQQGTFAVSQALSMDRHIGHTFQIPPGSIAIVSMLTIGAFVPIYDRVLVPAFRRITKREDGITLLQRMGIGLVFSVLSMVVAGLVEGKRRDLANANHSGMVAPMSVMWLAPQLILLGFAEAFNFIGQIEFYNRQFPENMRSIATSLFFCTIAGANYLSSLVVSLVHALTGKDGKPDWLTNDINQGRVDYFYYLLAGMGLINLVYFVLCARKYEYKKVEMDEGNSYLDVELNLVKH
ncbi:hypothetical protein Nepgr_032995 [Nepenthes gracilis]|uniref:Uncharacterized protein n=1 Tax=Nepenthes gracilis TaxID=150966 RepID=A0AAD3Y686_NEPGR|nr:hypothetical protein Nepgr_032995 [Nepenthes gracilis]